MGSAPAVTASKAKRVGVQRKNDLTLGWVDRDYPQLGAWRALAVKWLKGETVGTELRLKALVAFLERYLVQQNLPVDPAVLLSRNSLLPDFYASACPPTAYGVKYNNAIHAFLHFVLVLDFSEEDDHGNPVIATRFRNPVPRMTKEGMPRPDESVHSPLPYGYIDELRQMIVGGPHFCDWQWAQSILGAETGQRGRTGIDWFEVSEDRIDRSDPDCVWRQRPVTNGTRLEMWSPVRWVALLVKLILPLRTFQVRMLDSGEADTWRYTSQGWTLNAGRLAQGSQHRPLQQGVLRRGNAQGDDDTASTVLYINTNKTADIAKSGAAKGYVLPWLLGGPVHQDVVYWLEKLRNWQEKYNPVSHRTPWSELDARHISAKSEVQLAGYPDTCFLFRFPEVSLGERHLPGSERSLWRGWFRLLEALELRLADRGETHPNGRPIRFLPPPEEQNAGQTTLFPLHSLRVSLITALALEGQVPFFILQKLVGHSRLLMTLYYTKPGATYIHNVLAGAASKLEAAKEATIQNFLLDTEHNELLQKAICNSVPSLAIAIPQHPGARNPAGWMPMHHGVCLVGGNTSEVENSSVGGCYNGGALITGAGSSGRQYGPVPGGSRNCVRCRWFVTEPHYLPALAAHFNTLAYHFDEARNSCAARETELQAMKKERVDAEECGQPFQRVDAYRQAERVWEATMKRFSDLAEDLVACWRLIERCKSALGAAPRAGTQLVAAGTLQDVQLVFEETESELLQLAGVCENVELYPDLQPGKAVFRRSQLLDAALVREQLPPAFMLLSEDEQLLAGNAFIRRLAQASNPENPVLGQREVIRMMDAGESLSRQLGVEVETLLPTPGPARGHLVRFGGHD